jgi:O-succinylbenzoate synthase
LNPFRITAIHEAAHAVAAIRAGLVFDFVTAVPDDELELDGELHWTDLTASGTVVESPHLHAVVLLAGPCAEARERGLRADRVFSGVAAAGDREAVASLGLSEDEFLAATREALALIEKDWAVIERVAAELERGYDLEFEDVEEIVNAQA